MLLPNGRCYSHNRVMCLVFFFFFLLDADRRAMGLPELKLNLKIKLSYKLCCMLQHSHKLIR